MAKVTIMIEDVDGETHINGTCDNPNAANEPPTDSLVLGSYIASHAEKIAADAAFWFKSQVAPHPEMLG